MAGPPPRPGDWSRYYDVVEAKHVVLRFAPNGVCVVSLGASHPQRETAKVIEVNPKLHVEFSGRKKKGAMLLEASTDLCRIVRLLVSSSTLVA